MEQIQPHTQTCEDTRPDQPVVTLSTATRQTLQTTGMAPHASNVENKVT